MSEKPWSENTLNRITQLRECAAEDQIAISEESLSGMAKLSAVLGEPNVLFLSDSGNFRARFGWKALVVNVEFTSAFSFTGTMIPDLSTTPSNTDSEKENYDEGDIHAERNGDTPSGHRVHQKA